MILRAKFVLDQEKSDLIYLIAQDVKEFRKHSKRDPLLGTTLREISSNLRDLKSPHLDYKGRVQLLISTLHKIGTLDICTTLRGEEHTQRYMALAEKYKKEITPKMVVTAWNRHDDRETNYGFPVSLKDRYTYDGMIGKGGFGRVYRVINRKTGDKSVIKIIENENEYEGHSFLNEVVTWKHLRHENIVKFVDANISPKPDSVLYLEMEYIDGGNLAEKNLPLKKEDALLLMYRLLDGLEFAHQQNILHLDLKPANILLTKTGIPKLSDWGLSKMYSDRKSETEQNLGYTLAYAAPEQVITNFGTASYATDLYQMGAILYELLTGNLPLQLDYESMDRFTTGLVSQEPRPPSYYVESVSDIDPVVMKCLQKHPNNRYASAKELRDEIGRLLGFSSNGASNVEFKQQSSNGTTGNGHNMVNSQGNSGPYVGVENRMRNNEQNETDRQNINFNINLAAGDNISFGNGNDNNGSPTGRSDSGKTTKSLGYVIENLRNLLKHRDYSGIFNWLKGNSDYLRDKKPNCMNQLDNELLPNLEAVVKFTLDTTQVTSRIENFITCLEK